MNSPMITLIIPVHNSATFLPRTVQCIFAQTFHEWCAILVDDGSTDNSKELCDYYATQDTRFRAIHQPCSGPAAARNTGLSLVTTDFFVFWDDDDTVPPDFLQQLWSNSSNADTVVCSMEQHLPDGSLKLLPAGDRDCSAKDCFIDLIYGRIAPLTVFSCCNKLYRTDFIKRVHLTLPTDLCRGEDTIFNLSILQFEPRITLIDTTAYRYEIRSNSVMSTHPENVIAAQSVQLKLTGSLAGLFSLQNDVDFQDHYAKFCTDAFLFAAHQAAQANEGRSTLIRRLRELLNQHLLTGKQLLTARGKSPAWLLLSAVIRLRSGLLFWFWLVAAGRLFAV